jgi:low temperature requirement protein LtrA
MVEGLRGATEPLDREGPPHSGGEEQVTPLELFFDLVFVLSFTQVTSRVVNHGDWAGLGEAVVLAILIAYEAVHFREARERIRAGGLPESMMAEQEG